VRDDEHGGAASGQLAGQPLDGTTLRLRLVIEPGEHEHVGAVAQAERRLDHGRRDAALGALWGGDRGELVDQAQRLFGQGAPPSSRDGLQADPVVDPVLDRALRAVRGRQLEQGRAPDDGLALLGDQEAVDDELAAGRRAPCGEDPGQGPGVVGVRHRDVGDLARHR